MKTAVSIPDNTYTLAEQRAKELGWSRSKFYATAVERLLVDLAQDSLTEAINAAVAMNAAAIDDSSAAAVSAGRAVIAGQEW